ncbi:regulatory protein TetR [Coriobacterium glomerans PW2]|uniref:Regulatory protein TetR n=1 Tax=Coriobacterium glomerans (strain ATCC 49209 / DSM 20642 / JCM 10262 / PW2) TaxID=700015 RepID=F2N986_CORGP|nr:TetR/AcrR family transcriptional regulator [Coriobacterium glomerans]AEB07762.1 regulatory protein TetR [Coriobacterium glomerans PW2]
MGEIVTAADRLDRLSDERREAIASAGIEEFGRCGYQKASTEAIARKAGISKGLLFFYFSNKRALYLYLIDFFTERMEAIVADEEFYRIDDFFELLGYAARKKTAVFERCPWIFDFFLRVFYPEHRAVRDVLNAWNQQQIDQMLRIYFKNVRFDRFRDDVDVRHVVDQLIWLCDGYLHQQRCLRRRIDLDMLLDELEQWCDMLKAYAYKEEYR